MSTDPAVPAPRPPRRPESPAARQRRLQALEVALADREHRAREALSGLRGSLPRNRGHVTPLARIEDDEERLAVWRARVERLEALLDQTERKRETRAKIVLGTTLLAEAAEDPDDPLLARLLAIVDARVHRPRDRLAIAETLGLAIAPVKSRAVPALPDFDAMAATRLDEDAKTGAAAKPRRRKKGA
ncbi:hypothetical protein [Caulobacter sp. Root342]|uniref:hypothetical protein n=1 Tax=Caulobacter sp. Root342 TaxID=1736519 RepID=UPI0006FBF287|nr:hypothetical protein [Caulobacter sp. Root342]KQV54687.1 hypothetical protein ASC62_23140 [Caulobacter sp. Root342]